MGKNDHVAVADPVALEFGVDQFVENARKYREHKAIMNAASGYDSLDDAIAALTDVFQTYERQVDDGAGFTPATELGFGSDNGAQIAEKILGRQKSVGAIRSALATVGKVDK
jgi:hypothetical protein